MFAIDEGN